MRYTYFVLLLLAFSACQKVTSTNSQSVGVLPSSIKGTWGGNGIAMDLADSSLSVTLMCENGTLTILPGPTVNSFDASGFIQKTGGLLAGCIFDPSTGITTCGSNTQSAQFHAEIQNGVMELTAQYTDSSGNISTTSYTLNSGDPGENIDGCI